MKKKKKEHKPNEGARFHGPLKNDTRDVSFSPNSLGSSREL